MQLGNILSRYVYKDTRTLPIMNKFEEKTDDGEKKYSTLLLQDVCCVKYKRNLYWISFYIQRKPKDLECTQSRLTFSDFKKEIAEKVFRTTQKTNIKIIDEAVDQCKNITNIKDFEKEDYFLTRPIIFNAQNSSNRSGYGNRYVGDELVYEGTLYGETTEYMFIGVQYSKF